MTYGFNCPHCDKVLDIENNTPGDRHRALNKHKRRKECITNPPTPDV